MLYAIVTVIILIIDQAMKYWTNVNLDLGATSPFIPGFVQLTNFHNTGAAFSFLSDANARWFFVILTIIVAIGVIVLLAKDIIKGKLGRWMLVLVIAGGLGNCIDRVINGYVVDMFQFQFKIFGKDFAVFNVSDMFITICGVIFCLYLILHRESKQEKPATANIPSRVPPAERVVRADYITQLKKPVVEGRREIEAEIKAKEAEIKAREAEEAREREGMVTDWNMPDFSAEKTVKAPAPKTEKPAPTDFAALFNEPGPLTPKKSAAAGSPPAEKPKPVKAEPAPPQAQTEKTEKKAGDEFNIDDIIAEFKDQ